MKKLLTLFIFLFSIVAYGAVPLGTVPYTQLDTNDFGVTVAGHINTRLGVHTPSTPGDTWYLTINGTNINNGGTNFLQSINPTAGFLPVRGANTNFVDSLILQDATGLHVGTNFAGIIDYFGYPALTLGDTGGVNTYLTLYPDGLFLKDHYGNALNLYGQTANIGGLIYGKSIMQLGTMWGKVELADDNPAHTAKFQPTLPMGTSHTTLGSSTNAWEGLYAGSTKMFQFFDVIIDPGVSTNLNFAVDGVTYNIGAGGGSVGGTTINPTDYKVPYRLTAGSFGDTGMHPTNLNDMVFDGAVYLTTAAYDQNQFTNVDGILYIRNQPRITNAILSQVITLDGLAYNFPTAHDRAGSVLMDYDNAGTLTWSGSITNPLYNIYLSNVWVNGTMASGVNPTRWKVPYNADGTNFLDTGMHPTNTVDMVFDGDIFFGALTNRVFRNGTSLYYDNPNAVHSFGVTNSGSGGMAFMSIDATGDGANFQGGSLNSTWGIFDGSVGLIAYSNSKIDPTANGTIDFGSSSFLFKDTYSKRYFVGTNVFSTNSTTVTLNGVPIGVSTVTYAAVTNALLATGSASDVLHGDGSWGAGGGGGGGNMTNSGASVVGMVPVYTDTTGTQLTPTNSITLTGALTVNDGSGLPNNFGGGTIHASFYTSTNYTASITNYSITLGAACTNTLLSAATAGKGFWLHVKALAGGGEIWVQNGDFLDNVTNLVLAPWSARSFKSDGTNTWEIH